MFRILVVDDDVTSRDLTSRLLQKGGYDVETASSCEEGVAMAGRWRYDLIIMDMAMPGIGGGEATRLIRQDEKNAGTRRVPVIAFTANADEKFRQRAIRCDMDDFVVKPIERRQLMAAVERSLDDRLVVLVADDCAPDRERTLRYLRALGHVAMVAVATGAEAVEACARQRINIALINISLPDTSGIEAAHRIRKSRDGKGIGIVAISDKADPEARKHSIRHGYVGFLEKPFGHSEILDLIQPLAPLQV